MTIGEDRVRMKFNPSADSLVDKIKQQSAKLIDLCDQAWADQILSGESSGGGEAARLWSLAITHYENAAMWAVKAATIQK